MEPGLVDTPRSSFAPRLCLAIMLALFLVCGCGLWAVVFNEYRTNATPTPETMRDRVVFFAGGKLVTQGLGARLYDPDEIGRAERTAMGLEPARARLAIWWYLNPPFFAVLFAPV